MAETKKMRFTAEEKRSLLGGSAEPVIKPESYTTSMMVALNWYNVNEDRKTRTKYGVEYAKKVLKIDLSDCPDSDFITYGFLARLVSRGQPVSEQDIGRLNSYLVSLDKRNKFEKSIEVKDEQPAQKPAPKKTQDDVAFEQSNIFIEEIEQFIDENLYTPGTFEFPEEFFKRIQNPKVASNIKSYFQKRLTEIQELKESPDEQLQEGYSFLNRRKVSHYIKFLEYIVSSASTQSAIAKVEKARKPRAKKVKPASVIVKSLKYLVKDEELNIESLPPAGIVGAGQVVLYNTKRRTLVVVEALAGQTLTVKGTTIINNDPEKTVSKRLRKPETMVKEFYKATKRNTATAFKSIKTTEYKTASRTSEEVLILAINK